MGEEEKGDGEKSLVEEKRWRKKVGKGLFKLKFLHTITTLNSVKQYYTEANKQEKYNILHKSPYKRISLFNDVRVNKNK